MPDTTPDEKSEVDPHTDEPEVSPELRAMLDRDQNTGIFKVMTDLDALEADRKRDKS